MEDNTMVKIKNEQELISNAVSASTRRARRLALEAVKAAIEAVDPKGIILSKVLLRNDELTIAGKVFDLRKFKRIYVVGGGKAGGPMAEALEEILGARVTGGVVNVPSGSGGCFTTRRVELNEASHPIPNEAGVEGTRRMLEIAEEAGEEDLVLCIISGGGSSLMPQPREGISLEDKRRVTDILLKCGATINELNTVRKHLSRFKGGWLAKTAYPATIVSLLLSDVVGDPLDTIASGPTVPDPTTFKDAIAILEKYGVWRDVPASVRELLMKGREGLIPETPKEGDREFDRVYNFVVGNNRTACLAALEKLRKAGLNVEFVTSYMEGEAREVGTLLGAIVRELVATENPLPRPAALIFGGETTVTVKGDGTGGRNQELALGAALKISGLDGVVICSVGTDGVDGPTDAAGAIVDGGTLSRAEERGLDPVKFLQNNDTYGFFSKLGDLIFTGPTGTNVTDISLIIRV